MKKGLILLFTVVLGIGLLSLVKVEKPEATYNVITSSQAKEIFKTEDKSTYIILDVRTPSEYEAYHISGAINIPSYFLNEKAKEILKDKDKPIYVYCKTGSRSVTACQRLVKLGYKNVINFGGIEDYNRAK